MVFSLMLFAGTITAAFGQIGGPPQTILGDFKCYLPTPSDPLPFPLANVGLEDQFRNLQDVDVFDRELFCGHVIKNVDGLIPEFEDQHYLTYDIVINDDLPSDDCFNVLLEDQFMTSEHEVCSPDELWVPAEKDHDGIIFPIQKDTHYLCYPLSGDSPDEQATLFDQFVPSGENVHVLEPTHLCNPVLKTVGDVVFGEQIDEHLKCYNILNDIPPPEQSKDSAASVFVIATDQFNEPNGDLITSDTMEKLCVVAEKTILEDDDDGDGNGVVGGQFSPIDYSVLFITGIHSSAIWMIPTLAGVAGAAFYLIKFRTNKE